MIWEGLELTLLGMGVVYAFLGLMVVVINLLARILKPVTDREQACQQPMPRTHKPGRQRETEEKRRILAVISAAIAAHRAGEAHDEQFGGKAGQHPAGSVQPPASPRGRRRFPGVAGLLFRDRATFQVLLRK